MPRMTARGCMDEAGGFIGYRNPDQIPFDPAHKTHVDQVTKDCCLGGSAKLDNRLPNVQYRWFATFFLIFSYPRYPSIFSRGRGFFIFFM